MKKPFYLLLILSCSTPGSSSAQEADAVRSIQEEKWFYSLDAKTFEPSFKATNPEESLLGFYIGLNSDDLRILKICAPVGTAIWIDSQLILGMTSETCFQQDLSSWRSEVGKDSVFVLLHNGAGVLSNTELTTLSAVEAKSDPDQMILPVKRTPDRRGHFILLFTILFIAGTGFFRLQFPRIFRSFIDINRVLSFRVRDEMIAGFRLLSMPSVTIHLLVSTLGGFFLTTGRFYLAPDSAASSTTVFSYISEWMWFSLVLLSFLLAKRFLIQVFGEIFQMRGAVYLQVFEYLRSIFILLSASLFVYITFFYWSEKVTTWLTANMSMFASTFILSAIVLMFYKLAFETRHQKLHLFSYLCATEILPAILLLKSMFF